MLGYLNCLPKLSIMAEHGLKWQLQFHGKLPHSFLLLTYLHLIINAACYLWTPLIQQPRTPSPNPTLNPHLLHRVGCCDVRTDVKFVRDSSQITWWGGVLGSPMRKRTHLSVYGHFGHWNGCVFKFSDLLDWGVIRAYGESFLQE